MTAPRPLPDQGSPALALCFLAASLAACFAMAGAATTYLLNRIFPKETP